MPFRLKKYYFLFCLLFGVLGTAAQPDLRIELLNHNSHPGDTIFIAGSFNNWNPADPAYMLQEKNGKLSKRIKNLPAGVYEFKFTRGSWGKVQTKANGGGVENNLVKLTGDTTVQYEVKGWSDDFAAAPRQHTASGRVHIIDTGFYMPQLQRNRRIWVYLPKGYESNKKHYPVLYMHDGQNIFDDYTSGYGEWGVDECLDSLIAKGKPACIVVGIDNGPYRMNEYNPYDFDKFGKGEGDAYLDFLCNSLKPFIDHKYRTLPAKEHSIIAGSSMGGLISYYALLKRPGTFGKAGVFSPAFWTAPAIKALTDSLAPGLEGKLFFYMGELEGGTYVKDMETVAASLGEASKAMIYTVTDEEGRHNEQAWRKWFPEFYGFIMAEGFNQIVHLPEIP